MADDALRRIQAVSAQLVSSLPSRPSASLPEIKRTSGPSNAPRMAGKVAIITGANSPLGIGRATAHQFAESGARAVYVCDYDDTYLGDHKREIEAKYHGVQVLPRQFDAADETAVSKVVQDAMTKYGRLDVFFANAGIIGPHTLFTNCSDEDFMQVLKTNALR
jgi:NAD(P)-dependent dehydrogenase (short-subunit alcohol dehydrogenase family)